jgi:hypothetical protein
MSRPARDRAGLGALNDVRPDVVLWSAEPTTGTRRLAQCPRAGWRSRPGQGSVVVAGNSEIRDEVLAVLGRRGRTANVLPGSANSTRCRRGPRLESVPAACDRRQAPLRGPRFASLVRGPTPEVAYRGGTVRRVLGVTWWSWTGGATTDVYPSSARPGRATDPLNDVAGTLWHSRTVKATSALERAVGRRRRAQRLLRPGEDESLGWRRERADHPAYLPHDADAWAQEARLTELAATVAVRRHARGRTCAGSDDGRLGWCAPSPASHRGDHPAWVLNDHAGDGPCPERPRLSSMWSIYRPGRVARG